MFKNILIPTDLSENSMRGLDIALSLSSEMYVFQMNSFHFACPKGSLLKVLEDGRLGVPALSLSSGMYSFFNELLTFCLYISGGKINT